VKRVTINDVAKRAGVSLGTVSAVINEKNTVKPETRKAVLRAVKELNYRPWGGARNMDNRAERLWTISLLVRELDNPFYTGIAAGAMEYARSKGYLVIIASSEGDHKFEEKITETFLGKDIKGAIIAPVLEGKAEIEHLFRLRKLNFPFVLLESVVGIQANVVSIDNNKAMKEAMKYLIDNGHSRIVHFAGPRHASHTRERSDGFHRAYSESHLAFNNGMIIPTGAHLDDGYQKCLEYLRNKSRDEFPTAIVCYNDLVALGVMSALREMHIRVPDEISVVGNDDISLSRHTPVQLTTIRAPLLELGRKAAEILIRNIESHEPLPVETVALHSEFVVRESTKVLESPAVEQPHEIVQELSQPSPHGTLN
jgi:DNA-binding LacI/PurR family transcriptional regulator